MRVVISPGSAGQAYVFAELAYRPDGSSGLNFALRPSISTHAELGMKFLLGDASRATIALYRVEVSDEIVVANSTGGRTTFKNAGKTRRNGVEVGWNGRLGLGFEGAVALSWIDATFVDAFTSGAPPVPIASGNRLPGVPARSFYGELVWRHAPSGFHAGAEVRHNGRVYLDDVNSQSARSYTAANVRIGFDQQTRRWRFSEFLRIDNITDKKYIGSVIVAETNGRFYEPAPERNWLVGLSAQLTF